MNDFVDILKAVFIVLVIIAVVVAGSMIGAILGPLLAIGAFIYVVFLVIQESKEG